MKLTSQELVKFKSLLARADVTAFSHWGEMSPPKDCPISYSDLVERRRAQLDKVRG